LHDLTEGHPVAAGVPSYGDPESAWANPLEDREKTHAGDLSVHAYTLIPAEERPPVVYSPPPQSLPSPPLPPQSPPVYSQVPHKFSVPSVSSLERGKYYLQIGAYSQAAIVESELSRVERGHPLIVQNIGSSARPIYRILIGPVSQGEAGALLRKFLNSGYKDAFVRRG
jgi:hypothetical protein